MWTGASSEGFQRTVNQWYSAASDLQDSLRRLNRILRTTQANYRSALVTRPAGHTPHCCAPLQRHRARGRRSGAEGRA
ncbi:MAG: WXG100 family type VII secretion target [Sciscionella sp.]